MTDVKVEGGPSDLQLQSLGVSQWPIWTKEVSGFPWRYNAEDPCYFLEGEVAVTYNYERT